MNLYVREIVSPLEVFEYKKCIKKINSIKNRFIKKCFNNLLKMIINFKDNCFYMTGKIIERKEENYEICLIPFKKNSSNKIINKWIKNIKYISTSKSIKKIIISEKLKVVDLINKNFICSNEIEGKYLLKFMIKDVINYVIDKKNEEIERQEIYILVNEYSKFNLQLIEQLAHSVKNVNIVTNNLKKFLVFVNKIYEKSGIMITVSNNKRKSLKKAILIINVDFLEKNLEKYNINRTAIIINLTKEKINSIKGFSGLIINGMQIQKIKKNQIIYEKEFDFFDNTVFYESLIYDSYDFHIANEKIKNDAIKIEFLIGQNGAINMNEYGKIA